MTRSDQSPGSKPSKTDQILDLLLDALAERQEAKRADTKPLPTGILRAEAPGPAREDREGIQPARVEKEPPSSPPPPRPKPLSPEARRAEPAPAHRAPARQAREPRPGEAEWEPPPRLPSINLGKTLGRLLILVALLIVIANIPVTRYGVSLARIMPDTASLIVRDGLVVKGSGQEIYIMEDSKLRWISSMDAFEHLGLTWQDVHVVEDAFLDKLEKGRPIHVLLKCRPSPHIYRLENQEKRWIRDIDTFLAEGHIWEDVRFVTCDYLRSLPDGAPIPEDAGPPPEP